MNRTGGVVEGVVEGVVQVAYLVNDIREAARRMHALTGAGPFFVFDKIELEWGEHRGRPCRFVHSSAYGQWGNMMMELVQQDSDGPSPFRDLYAPGEEGLHHVAVFVDSIDAALEHYTARGIETAARARARVGTEFAFIDTSPLMGHMIEVYVADSALTGFYGLVREASINWDGSDIVRTL